MKKIIVASGLFVVLLTAGVSSAKAQVSIIVTPPGYGYVYPNYGYNFYSGPGRGGCGGYNNGWGNGYRGGYGNNYNGWGNGYRGGYGYGRGGRGGGHHGHGCR
jgi:hypothetical protein